MTRYPVKFVASKSRRIPQVAGGDQRSRAGFTLVEILAVIAILALLFSLAMPIVTRARAAGDVTACQSNLRNIALTLGTYVDTRRDGKWPKDRGVRLLLLLHQHGEIEGESLKTFVCPGTNDETWPPGREGEWGAGFEDWDDIATGCISYAGRDMENFPIRKDKLDQMVIAADDNEIVPNHSHLTNLVYADGRVSKRDLKDFPELEDLGLEAIPVGPDSPDEELAKLLVD